MLKNSQATQTAFKELLDMKQKHAIRTSQEQTEWAADSSRSIMVFTVFTIIFSPLSFFASVLGINAREWSGVGTNRSLCNVFAYMVSMSFAVTVLALLLAFNGNVRRLSQRVCRSAALPILGLVRLLCYYPRRWYHAQQVFWFGETCCVHKERALARRLSDRSRMSSRTMFKEELKLFGALAGRDVWNGTPKKRRHGPKCNVWSYTCRSS